MPVEPPDVERSENRVLDHRDVFVPGSDMRVLGLRKSGEYNIDTRIGPEYESFRNIRKKKVQVCELVHIYLLNSISVYRLRCRILTKER